MEDDYGEDTEFDSVVVPLSLIYDLTFEMLDTIYQWHENRKIEDINHRQTFAAMMAAIEAVMEHLDDDGKPETLQ
jgi:predicted HTH transcriptional regulator